MIHPQTVMSHPQKVISHLQTMMNPHYTEMSDPHTVNDPIILLFSQKNVICFHLDTLFPLLASPFQCWNNCWCHFIFEEEANVLNCSQTNITSLTELRIPNETMWLVAKYNHIPHLQWWQNLAPIQHFDLENSSVRQINDDFFTKFTAFKKKTFLDLTNNDLRTVPKTLNGTSFYEVYLAGNPIDCNCEMLWFANFLNTTDKRRIVKDYKRVLCAGGKWNGTQVYKLNAEQMGCYPKILAKSV